MEDKYFLTLRHQKGNEVKIDISLLEVAKGFYPRTLEEIDNFTLNFTKKELLQEIEKANIAGDFIDGLLCITDNHNHNHNIYTQIYV